MALHTLGLRIAAVALLIFSLSKAVQAQFSTFVSGTYASQSNPLYNYEQTGDQVRAAYLEVAYSAEQFRGKYAGGLTLFNRLTERNYLDHSLLLTLSFRPEPSSTAAMADSNESESSEEVDDGEAPVSPDSLGVFGEISAKVTGRHDKAAFREYDNAAAALGGSVGWGFDGWHIRLVADAGYRAYPLTKELSNASGLLTAEVGLGKEEGFSGGLHSLAGVKHFTVAAFDSARFEPVRTYVTVTKPGSGKGGAKITVKQGSGKEVLANADVLTAGHFAGAGFVRFGWETGSVQTELLYRHNLSASARILARTPETATINEDIYNDFFSYNGPEANLTVRQSFPGSIRAVVSMEYQRKQFGAPAFDLEGVEIAGARVDRRTGIELYASRYFSLSSEIGLDIALSGSVVRNESNDTYNDFSGWSLGFSLGFGF